MWYHHHEHLSGIYWIWFTMVLLIVAVVYFIFRYIDTPGSGETAMDILRKRYAKGEISEEEFDRMKNNLKQ